MASLLDIAAAAVPVEINGVKLEVSGLSAKKIAALAVRFPLFAAALGGGNADLTSETIVEVGPEFVAAAIAAGCGFAGDPKAEAIAADMAVGHQVEIMAVILEQTLPGGSKKVYDRLGAAATAVGLLQTPSPEASAT